MDFSTSSSSEDKFVVLLNKERLKKKKKSYWVQPILEKREKHMEFHRLIQELELYHDHFLQYFMISVGQFQCLLNLVAPSLIKS